MQIRIMIRNIHIDTGTNHNDHMNMNTSANTSITTDRTELLTDVCFLQFFTATQKTSQMQGPTRGWQGFRVSPKAFGFYWRANLGGRQGFRVSPGGGGGGG